MPPGTRFGNRYVLDRTLGHGGYGVVYLAHDEQHGQHVALKILRADRLNVRSLRRLEREAQISRRLSHPNLVRVIDFGASDEVAYLTMERVVGETLRDRLKRGALTPDDAVRIASEILRGLAALHAEGVVHRDVKPSNVLLDSAGHAKLSDLGLARHLERDESGATETSGLVGTVGYLSPEQALGQEVDGRSDLYSLGVLFFEMATGRLPYESRSTLGAVVAHLTQPAPDVRASSPGTPAWLAAVIARLLEKDPRHRYARAADVVADLDAKRAPHSRRSQSSGQAWRGRGALAVSLGLVILVVALASTWRTGVRPAFAELVSDGQGHVVARDADGHEIWRRPGHTDPTTGGGVVEIRLAPSGRPHFAALLAPTAGLPSDEIGPLEIIDGDTGQTVRLVNLPSASHAFPGISDRYGPVVRAIDIDEDGVSEVLITCSNLRMWPSYTLLYEPRLDRARLLFLSSGHALPVAARDVDGDGRNEVLFVGTANRMGWYRYAAAVRVGNQVNRLAWTPDEVRGSPNSSDLVWFVLLPLRADVSILPRASIPAPREILIGARGGDGIRLNTSGFLVGAEGRPRVPDAPRARRREAAYEGLREAKRLGSAGQFVEGLNHARKARRDAEEAGDSLLALWAGRVAAALLASSGDLTRAEALFNELLRASAYGEAGVVAIDAARAFHRRGLADRAAEWYRRSLLMADPVLGTPLWESAEGLVLALGERGSWGEATKALSGDIVQQRGLTPQFLQLLLGYIEWRQGRIPDRIPPAPTGGDCQAYWHLEFRLARGEEPGTVLRDARREAGVATETLGLLASVEAEALSRLGRRGEALARAREALQRTQAERDSSIYARVHLPIVEARLRRLEAGR